MNPVSSYNSTFPASQGFQGTSQSYAELQATRLSLSESQRKDITISTREGDRVTISINEQSQSQSLTYEGFQRTTTSAVYQDQSLAGKSLNMFQGDVFESESNKNISVTVDGDLNGEELEDIAQALKSIDRVMTHFLYGGDMTESGVQDMKIMELDTIAGLDANYRYEKSVILEQTSLKEISMYSSRGNSDILPPINGHHNFDQAKSLLEELGNIIKESKIEPGRFEKPLRKLFLRYRDNPRENEHRDSHRIRVREWIEAELQKQIALSTGFKTVSEFSPEQ